MQIEEKSKSLSKIYSDLIIQEIPRLLSLMDRNPDSETYGCCDRNHWQYKVKWFVDFRFQELAYTLALVYLNNYPDNPYYKKKKIKEWALAAMLFWAENQNRDGSFTEWYTREHSFPTTVFSTATIKDAFWLLDLRDDRILKAIIKAEDWTRRHNERLVSNQEAGAIYFLGDWPEGWRRLRKFLEMQSEEGWWPEYSNKLGDVGYSTVTLSYLTRCWKITKDKELFNALKKLTAWLARQKETGSRDTQFILPDGLEIMAPYDRNARRLADANLRYLERFGLSYDDKYMASFSSHYLLAYDNFYAREVRNVKPLVIKSRDLPVGEVRLPNPFKTLITIPAQVFIGRSDWLSQKMKNVLRRRMILKQKNTNSIYTPSKFYFYEED